MENLPLGEPKTPLTELDISEQDNMLVEDLSADSEDEIEQAELVSTESAMANSSTTESVRGSVSSTSKQSSKRSDEESGKRAGEHVKGAHNSYTVRNDTAIMRKLKNLMNILTNDPGEYENVLHIFLTTLSPFYENIPMMLHFVEHLVKQVIEHQSFRYTAARLCSVIEVNSSIFRFQLHLTCQFQVQRNKNIKDIVLFIAELYMQLGRNNPYGEMLLLTIKQMVKQEGDSKIKCVCQALKLAGYSLDRYDIKAMNYIISRLMRYRRKANESNKNLINLIFNLRNSNWGYAENTDTESSLNEDGAATDGVLLDTKEESLSQEEISFLTSTLNVGGECDNQANIGEPCIPEPAMDD